MAKIKLNLGQMGMAAKLALLKKVKQDITGNANFPLPNPPLIVLTSNIATADTFDTTLTGLEAQLATQVQARRAFYTNTMDTHLAALAAYVESTSLGDAAKIASSGFELAGGGGGPVVIGQVANLAATVGDDAGEIDLAWDRVPGATLYEVWRNSDPNNPAGWAFVCSCTKSKATVTGLVSGTKYWFRVRAMGGHDGSGPWSDPATCFAP